MFSFLPSWVPLTFFIIDWTVRIILAIIIVLRRRAVNTSLAWLVVVMFLPLLGVPLYLLIGENRLGIKRLSRYESLTKGIETESVKIWHSRHLEMGEPDAYYAQIARFGTNATGFPPLKGNHLTCLNTSQSFIDGICRDIDAATEHVHILTYIWQCTGAGDQVAQATIRAAQRGVECRVLVDGVGSAKFLKCDLPHQMRKAGVQVVEAMPVSALRALFARLDLRNHRKIVVVDGKIAYAGSQNISDDTFRSKPHRDTGPWIDASLRISGPAVYALQAIFLRDWILDSDEKIPSVDRYIPAFKTDTPHPCVVQVIPSGPGVVPQAIHQALLTTIYSAREELVMTTPYFVPDDATRAALQAAATRGVRVTLVMPKVSDSILVAAASRSHYIDLLESGVRILHYRDGLLHAKTVTIDRNIALVGSANFDARSFWLNFEATLFIYDDDFASALRFMQNDYIAKSDEIDLNEWRRRPRWDVFVDNIAQLAGPLL